MYKFKTKSEKKKTFVNKVRIRLAKTVEAFFFFLACVCGYPSGVEECGAR